MSFGENLQYYRSEGGLTQEQLAERLEVSRQSVSKWESDASFPEMDKLLVMCNLFGCTLDTLLRGDAKASRQADTAGYNAHMDRFAAMITAGVVLCACGFPAAALVDAFLRDDRWSGIVFLLLALCAVVLFIIGGLQHSSFCRENAHIEPFYDKKTLFAWRQRFPVFIAVGVALCIGGVIVMMLLEGVSFRALTRGQCEGLVTGAGLLVIAAGAGLLTYGGIQNSKYHVEGYNRERIAENEPRNQRLGRIHGAIILTAAGVFLVYFYIWRISDWIGHGLGFGAMLIFGIGWLLCGIVDALFKKDS